MHEGRGRFSLFACDPRFVLCDTLCVGHRSTEAKKSGVFFGLYCFLSECISGFGGLDAFDVKVAVL
jgi:hypothetical protein